MGHVSPLVPFPIKEATAVSKLRALFNKLAPNWKKSNPNVAAWMDEATTEIDRLNKEVFPNG